MSQLNEKFIRLKTRIGGNREKFHYEETFGMPKEEQLHITMPEPHLTRIISELLFVLKLSEDLKGAYDEPLESALDYLLEKQRIQGTLTIEDTLYAEKVLSLVQTAAKEYELILAAHAHIDMNWMWSYDETVAIVLSTFRSILNIMDQYPDFTYSQSQAAVYRIVEEQDPELMEEIKARIAEGRWEVTATAWVETDKNMPDGESLLRHIQETKTYLSRVWGVKNFDLDFSPDTFGHSANIPEINSFGDVKYYYHCRGNYRKDILYRYRGLSGREILTYREPNWYNGAITPHMAAGLIDISHRTGGLKTGLVVYGVGDHGGGPTRRDVERALEMADWPIYPHIRFGTIRDYFLKAETVRNQLPVVDEELNYFSPGCYTTQSRIKRGNRQLEGKLLDAETMSALASDHIGFVWQQERLSNAWRQVLFTHFHDILTGSCVQDTREHAMGLFQQAKATADTQLANTMRKICLSIDTSGIPVDIDGYNSQSEGAGAGYGLENFIGVPSTERGSGRTRIFHIFNTKPFARRETVTLTVWDWTGDLRHISVRTPNEDPIPFQLLDGGLQQYWDHKFVRILVDVTVPAIGYTTIVLFEREAEGYPVYLQENEHVSRMYDDLILENEHIRVRIDAGHGRITSLQDIESGRELIAAEKSAGLTFLDTESDSSSAWNIGRSLKETPVAHCIKLEQTANGKLRQAVRAVFRMENSKAEILYSLDKESSYVRMELTIDWHEIAGETVPVLDYRVPLSYEPSGFIYDIPAGTIERPPVNNDVPGLKFGLAKQDGPSVLLMSDCKYGYRGYTKELGLKLINSSRYPDPYPERSIHHIVLALGVCCPKAGQAEIIAQCFNHPLYYQPSNAHKGSLPLISSMLAAESGSALITAVCPTEEGILIRGYETEGKESTVTINFHREIISARCTDLFGNTISVPNFTDQHSISIAVNPFSLFELHLTLL